MLDKVGKILLTAVLALIYFATVGAFLIIFLLINMGFSICVYLKIYRK